MAWVFVKLLFMNRGMVTFYLMLVCVSWLTAQQISLFDGKREVYFRQGSWFEIAMTPVADGVNLKNATFWYGNNLEVLNDTLSLRTEKITRNKLILDTSLSDNFYFPSSTLSRKVPVREVLYIKHYRDSKTIKRKQFRAAAGGVLFFSGVLTGLTALAVENRSDRQKLLISGGIQFGLGFAIGISSTTKAYYLRSAEKNWLIRKR